MKIFFEYNGATCFSIDVPNIGPAKAIAYDIAALKKAIEIAKENRDKEPIFYILACRIGPFIGHYKVYGPAGRPDMAYFALHQQAGEGRNHQDFQLWQLQA